MLPVSIYIEDGPGVELARLSVEQQRIVRLLVEKVIVSPDDLEARFRPNGIEVLALELQPAAEDVEEAVA